MLADAPSQPSSGKNSEPATDGEPAVELAQTLLRLQEEQAVAQEDAKAREQELEESLRDAQKVKQVGACADEVVECANLFRVCVVFL